MKAKEGELRVWWIPQLGAPIPNFYWAVKSVDEAKLLLDCLAQYDLYQLKNRIKPDFSNAGGLEIYEKNYETKELEWCEWMDDDGNDIDQHFEELAQNSL